MVDLVSVMGVYGSAEKVLLTHSPSKIPAPIFAVGEHAAAPAQVGGARGVRPPRARAKAKAAPKHRAGKFAAPNLQNTVAAKKKKARGKKT